MEQGGRMATTTITYAVKRGADVGSLELDANRLCFTPKNSAVEMETNTTIIPWDQLAKHQANPQKNAKAMVKIVSQDGAAVTFQLKNRTILDAFQEDVAQRIESYGKGGDGNTKSEDSQYHTDNSSIYCNVGFLSTIGCATLTKEGLDYQANDQGKSLIISWTTVTKHQASPPKISKALLKLFLSTGKNHTFQLADRRELKRFQDDAAQRIQNVQVAESSEAERTPMVDTTMAAFEAGEQIVIPEQDGPSQPQLEITQIEDEGESNPGEETTAARAEGSTNVSERKGEVQDGQEVQAKGQASREHSPLQAASQSPREKEGESRIKKGEKEDVPENSTEKTEADDSIHEKATNIVGKVESIDSSAGIEAEASSEDSFERDQSDVTVPKIDKIEKKEENITLVSSGASIDGVQAAAKELAIGVIFYSAGCPRLDMDDSIDSLVGLDNTKDDLPESVDEPIEIMKNEFSAGEEIDMDEGAVFAEAAVDYEEEEDESTSNGENLMQEYGDESFDEEKSLGREDVELISFVLESDDFIVEMDAILECSVKYPTEEGSSEEDLDISEEIAHANIIRDAKVGYMAHEESYTPSSQIDKELQVNSEQLYDEEEGLSSLLGVEGGLDEDLEDEGLEDFDALLGKPYRTEGQHGHDNEFFDTTPRIGLRRRSEYDSDEDRGAAGFSDEEETPFFDDEMDDDSGAFGVGKFSMVEGGSLPQALVSGARGDGSVSDSVSSEETLSLSGLTGVTLLSSNVSNISSEDSYGEEEGESLQSGSASEEEDIHSEEDSGDSASDSSDTASFEDESDYSPSDSDENASDDDSSETSSSQSDDGADEDSEDEDEEELMDYHDPASAWLTFSETKDEEVFPEVPVPLLKMKQKQKKKKKRRGDSDFEQEGEEYYSGDEVEDYRGEMGYSDEEGDYSYGDEEEGDDSEQSIELELDLEDLSVDDLEGALVSKLQAEIGDSGDARLAVHEMLRSLREELLHGRVPSGKSKREHPGMPEDFYDWAKQTATKVLDRSSQKSDSSPEEKEAESLSSPCVAMDEAMKFNWKKFAKEGYTGSNNNQEEPGKAEQAPAPDAMSSKATAAIRSVDVSLPLAPYDDALVEQWTLRPKPDDTEIRLFNWKGFTSARRPITDPGEERASERPTGTPSFDWKKHRKERRKLERRKAKAADKVNSTALACEEKKSDEEQEAKHSRGGELIINAVDLLKRLLVTEEESARSAILNQYLAPPASPDQTEGLVPPDDLLQAITKFVEMIRTVKKSDNAPEITSARQVAIVARLAILNLYGHGSKALSEFEMGLAPAFAPKFAN